MRPGTRAVADLVAAAGLLVRLPGYLRRRLTVAEARAVYERRLERRAADFLAQARRAVYPVAGSPWRALLGLAGCEPGDLERLLADDGLEGALATLYRRGVYLTVDELKGRRPVVRGSARLAVAPADLRNRLAAVHALHRTGGSRGPATAVPLDLAYLRDNAVNTLLALDARGGLGWRHAVWGDPGLIALLQLLYAAFGAAPLHWFTQVDLDARSVHPRYRWSARAVRAASRLAGLPLDRPEYVPLDDPAPIAAWMAGELAGGRVPHLVTFASTAVRVCRAALERGLDLGGAQFSVGGEPLTAARLAAIERAGAVARPHYGSTECGAVGTECLAPATPDDVHVCRDRIALLQPGPGPAPGGLPPRALLVSSLRPTAPFVLLNASLGDQADLVRRDCGCLRGRPGGDLHLQSVRSFEKLTAGGMTFFDRDVIRVLEEALPARFGGGPTDYQLVEQEAPDGRPELRLLIHPAVGPVDPAAAAETFLAAVGAPSDRERVMEQQWRQAGLVRVERRPPLVTAAGKVLHLHQVERAPIGRDA